MASVDMLNKKSLFEKASRFATLVDLALHRVNESERKMTVWKANRQGEAEGGVPITREKISCDFTKAANLEIMDRQILPVIASVLDRADQLEMTAVRQMFSKQALYAIRELESVSRMDFQEITYAIHPELRPKPVVLGQILQFHRAA